MHYLRKKSGSSNFLAPARTWALTCQVEGCGKKNYGSGYCQPHYNRFKRYTAIRELVEMLGGKCSDCNKVYPLAVYDFHHLDPSTKEHTIGQIAGSLTFETVKAEALKCILLCANCHRERHFRDFGENVPQLKAVLPPRGG